MNKNKPENCNSAQPVIENLNTTARELFNVQLEKWPMALSNYKALIQVKTKSFSINDFTIKVQFNPARITSSAAKTDSQSIKERKCFLCTENLPTEQIRLLFGNNYQILVNPFPIFPVHFTLPAVSHDEQLILERYTDMLDLSKSLDKFIIFYNGPRCGASAPDHAHFQAGNKGFLPIEDDIKKVSKATILSNKHIRIYSLKNYLRNVFILESNEKETINCYFRKIYSALDFKDNEPEPMMNVLTWYENDKWISCIFPRKAHRPSFFYAENDKNILISPASVDMGGIFITPLEKDFSKITAADIEQILKEVCIDNEKMELIISKI